MAVAPMIETDVHLLSDEQVAFYHENGYLVVEDVLSTEELQALRDETARICRGERGLVQGLPDFDPSESDEDIIARTICVHFPHKISDVMLDAVTQPGIVEGLTQLIGPNVKCMQSMLFIKSAGKPGQAWHQDEAFIPTRDCSLTAAWMALEDATPENGCLWAIPGSHRLRTLWPFRDHDDERYDCAQESFDFPFTDDDGVMVPAKAGSVVFFNGYLLHRSLPNYAESGFRRALVNHYMSAESLLPWHLPEPGTSMAMADIRDIVMVAGTDPYAYKGIQTDRFAHVRPDKEGGCQWPSKVETGPEAKANGAMGADMGGGAMGGGAMGGGMGNSAPAMG